MSEDMLGACVSLPMWFPPVLINGARYIDAVYATDANLEEAIRRGADELWVIWTVSQLSDWEPGFVATYFQIIEAAANGRYNAVLERIAINNGNIAAGLPGEFGRPITVREIKGEVPLQYLINLSSDRFKEAVNMGVDAARKWCGSNGISTRQAPTDGKPDQTQLTFTEEMKGFVSATADFDAGFRAGEAAHQDLMFHLDITIDGVFDFVDNMGPAQSGGGRNSQPDRQTNALPPLLQGSKRQPVHSQWLQGRAPKPHLGRLAGHDHALHHCVRRLCGAER